MTLQEDTLVQPTTLQTYLENRENFPQEKLVEFRGQWIAWSPDGTRIVARATDLQILDDLIQQEGEDPEQCPLERVPEFEAMVEELVQR